MDTQAFQKVPGFEVSHEMSSTADYRAHELGAEQPVAELRGDTVQHGWYK